ncbi:hypothetical protein [Aureimonas leprariae]|uniref:Uncharacterized protein n=1 Tax=Plantimonas leprariae TaxID=2615207 RepID=A0A7V7PRS1_9HYPH|nr:hypothetical protein [Aureimonas leprariae]KAB0681493.1 hypothetical protein F6X38_06325 [Aureimonas leprariae]
MPFLHHVQHSLAPAALAAAGIAWSVLVQPLRAKRRLPTLREENLSDWLLADIGCRDGRDTGARREARRCALPPRAVL